MTRRRGCSPAKPPPRDDRRGVARRARCGSSPSAAAGGSTRCSCSRTRAACRARRCSRIASASSRRRSSSASKRSSSGARRASRSRTSPARRDSTGACSASTRACSCRGPRPSSRSSGPCGTCARSGARTAARADVGTGSGAIAVTLAASCASSTSTRATSRRTRSPSRGATRRATTSSSTSRSCTAISPSRCCAYAPFDCVVANLPYVPSAECARAPDPVSFEPLLARDGGADGLALYRRLVRDLPALVAPRGIAILEAAPVERARARGARARRAAGAGVETIRDYADLDRFVVAISASTGL